MILKIITFPIRLILEILIFLYKFLISPLFPHTCRFYPTCSTYMLLSIREWGVFKGSWLGLKRITRCRPRGKTGYDFVPQNLKGDLKWIY